MKKQFNASSWNHAVAIGSIAISLPLLLAACDDSSGGSSDEIPVYGSEAALPNTCEMAVAQVGISYFACLENKWVAVVDSAIIEKIKDGLGGDKLKAELEELMSKQSSSSTESNEDGSSSSIGDDDLESSSSGSTIPANWSWDVPKEARLNPKIIYGTLTDHRDSKVYKTVKIGDQTWMAENLDYADSVTTPSLKGKSRCYNDVVENCAVTGRLYTWAAAIDSVKLYDGGNGVNCGYLRACTLPEKVSGICPSGWHLPTKDEWQTLFTAVGGSSTAGAKLKSQTGWPAHNGITNEDAYGFSALPAGIWHDDLYFNNVGNMAYFWSATQNDWDFAYYMYLCYYDDEAHLSYYSKSFGLSVRCLKD